MVSFDPCSFGLTGEYAILVDICLRPFHLFTLQSVCCRDEEKKMGTLVKEDFGRPDRASTMVRHNLTVMVHISLVLFVSGV